MRKDVPRSSSRPASAKAAPRIKKTAPVAASRRFNLSMRASASRRKTPRRQNGGADEALVCELAGGGNDRPPAFDLARQFLFQCVRRRLILGRRSSSEFGKALNDG